MSSLVMQLDSVPPSVAMQLSSDEASPTKRRRTQDEDGNEPASPRTPTKKDGKHSKSVTSPKKTNGESPSKKVSPWTSDMRLAVLSVVVKKAAVTKSDFEACGKLLGKSAEQCYDQWRKKIAPDIERKIGEGL